MLLLVLCFALSTLAVQCRGSQHSSCAAGQCKVVRGVEVCTRCRAGHVLVNGVCTGNSAGNEAVSECRVQNCAECKADDPTKCERCEAGFTANVEQTQCNQDQAPECRVQNCAECKADDPTKCERCEAGFTANVEQTQCNQDQAPECRVQNCAECKADDPTKCERCEAGFTANVEQTQCNQDPEQQCNTPNCKACDNPRTDREVCTECSEGNYLTPTKQCTQSCGTLGGYYNGDKVCEPCDPSCAACATKGPTKCTLCPPGKRLQYTDEGAPQGGGSCVDECRPEGGAGGCETCGATIGGTKYCSKCSTSAEVPVNGVCTADNARASACKVKDGKGGCTTCDNGYFLQDGGCYKLGRQPGEQICTTASSTGKCETCANSLRPTDGVCPSCHPTCKTCSAADIANACTTCATGYYMLGLGPATCTSCERDSGNVKGVSGCLSCAPPSGNTGSVLCYLTKDDGTGGSVNKSGLSTGAIAGIAVAAIVVVGGLVGFLCWWFLCRGKA
ncbi:VSP [Giardia lamblia P15]|uniref:VSP n=1 Tax=Giardia intestinalis (strain P15) TaxID=658858 RepID=E1F7F9_GIAIA|nr:VSP [Giardia lamblia P15]